MRLASLLLVLLTGCTASQSVITAFPPASQAAPWVLRNDVWHGSLTAAHSALGDEFDTWHDYGARHVWLARYCHEDRPQRCLTVRIFAFDTVNAAQRAYEREHPVDADAFEAGDQGCWTPIGILFQWQRLVCEVFGDSASWGDQVQASFLVTYLLDRMPPQAPQDPR